MSAASFGEPPQADNVHYLGMKPHDDLPAYVQRFDIAIRVYVEDPGAPRRKEIPWSC